MLNYMLNFQEKRMFAPMASSEDITSITHVLIAKGVEKLSSEPVSRLLFFRVQHTEVYTVFQLIEPVTLKIL